MKRKTIICVILSFLSFSYARSSQTLTSVEHTLRLSSIDEGSVKRSTFENNSDGVSRINNMCRAVEGQPTLSTAETKCNFTDSIGYCHVISSTECRVPYEIQYKRVVSDCTFHLDDSEEIFTEKKVTCVNSIDELARLQLGAKCRKTGLRLIIAQRGSLEIISDRKSQQDASHDMMVGRLFTFGCR